MQRYQMIKQDDIIRIHETTLKILENIGIIMEYEPAQKILAAKGAKVEGSRIYFPAKMVESSLKTAPRSFTLYARNPDNNIYVDPDTTIYVGPFGCPAVTDLDRGRRSSTNEDFINIIKILQMTDAIDVIGYTSVEPNDIPTDKRANHIVYSNFKYSDKPIYGSIVGEKAANDAIDMAATVFGGRDVLKKKPGIVASACSLSPLAFDSDTLAGIMVYAEAAQPLLITCMAIAGFTAPATLAGCVAMQNAEILAGIILAQCVNPGTPVIYSGVSTNADMRTGAISSGSAERAVIALMTAQMARFYDIPNRITGSATDSKTLDAQAGMEGAITGILAQMCGGNFIQNSVGESESHNCLSYEKLIMDIELINIAKRIQRGAIVDENTLAYDALCKVGPMGHFLSSKHTIKNYAKEFSRPIILDRQNVLNWEQNGKLTLEQRANSKWKQILSEYKEPTLPEDIDCALKKFIL